MPQKKRLATLRAHIFNWKVWPDFNAIPDAAAPFLHYNEVRLGETLDLDGRKFTALPVSHIVPAVGYCLEGDQYSLVYTGDTTVCDALWVEVNKINNLKYLIIETAFSNRELELAQLSKHLCPSMLTTELAKLDSDKLIQRVEVFITHLKPGEGEIIMHEIAVMNLTLAIDKLKKNQTFHL